MSRIGRKPVALPSGVTVDVKGTTVHVKGPKGELSYVHLPQVKVKVEGSDVIIERAIDTDEGRAMHGLTRALIANMVQGVTAGYEKQLEIVGVGYKALIKGKTLVLNLGHSHPIDFPIPAGVTVTQDEKNKNILKLAGIDKQLIGQTAAHIRGLRPPEPYKGKGIRYLGEPIRRKVGKAATAKSAA